MRSASGWLQKQPCKSIGEISRASSMSTEIDRKGFECKCVGCFASEQLDQVHVKGIYILE